MTNNLSILTNLAATYIPLVMSLLTYTYVADAASIAQKGNRNVRVGIALTAISHLILFAGYCLIYGLMLVWLEYSSLTEVISVCITGCVFWMACVLSTVPVAIDVNRYKTTFVIISMLEILGGSLILIGITAAIFKVWNG